VPNPPAAPPKSSIETTGRVGLCGDGSLTRQDGSKTRPHIFPYTIGHCLDVDCYVDIVGGFVVPIRLGFF
jgi:hypothetical protein